MHAQRNTLTQHQMILCDTPKPPGGKGESSNHDREFKHMQNQERLQLPGTLPKVKGRVVCEPPSPMT
jgi:hypothetical protein